MVNKKLQPEMCFYSVETMENKDNNEDTGDFEMKTKPKKSSFNKFIFMITL